MDDVKAQIEILHADAFVWAIACCDGDRAEAEDVLQTTYLKVMDGRARFGGRSTFKTWIFGVVRMTAKERRRRRKVRRFLLFEWGGDEREPDPTAPQRLEAQQRRELLLRLLAELSDRQREVLELVFYHDMTVEEASEVMDVSLGTARTHYHRGKQALAARLESMKSDEATYARAR